MKLPYPSYLLYRFGLILLVIMITGCSGSSGTPNPPEAISVALSPQPPSSTNTGSTINLTAVVSNDGANAGVTWSVTCGSSQCGSFSRGLNRQRNSHQIYCPNLSAQTGHRGD